MKKSAIVFTNAAIAALLLSGCADRSAGPGERPVPDVYVATPTVKTVEVWKTHSGELRPIEAVEVRARVNGYLTQINFTDGQRVEEGDLLFQIDPRPYQAVVDSAKAAVQEAKARVALAKSNLERAKELYASNAISKEIYDTRQAEQLSAQASQANAEASLRDAELNLEFTRVVAPISGMISEHLVDRGNLVTANSTLLTTIVRRNVVRMHFDVSERDMLDYAKSGVLAKVDQMNGTGPDVEVVLPLDPENKYTGQLTYFDNRLGRETASLVMRADLDNKDGRLMPGQNARVRVRLPDRKDAILVPETAVGTDLVDRYVRVVDKDNVVRFRKIIPGQLFGKLRLVESGLEADERIVVVGMQKATFGSPVNPLEKPAGQSDAQ